jgi:hypothetical protein
MDLPQGGRAVDAAVLAGAGYLQSTSVSEPQAVSVTVSYVEKNRIKKGELSKTEHQQGLRSRLRRSW